MVSIIRRVMEGAGFLDIETPILFKPTPEGARDFLVPSRLQQGRFFALPQSPQILKQLLVIGGFERYYQIARCFRDEDLRADRSHELTQLDVEMAFPDVEFILGLMEKMVREIWNETLGVELETPFPRITYGEARCSATAPTSRTCGSSSRSRTRPRSRAAQSSRSSGRAAVRYLRVPQEYPRADLDEAEAFAKQWGAKGLAYIVYGEEGSRVRRSRSSSPRPSSQPSAQSRDRPCSSGPTSRTKVAARARRAALRLGHELGLIDEDAHAWIVGHGLPDVRVGEEDGADGAVHHPFTRADARVESTARQGSRRRRSRTRTT